MKTVRLAIFFTALIAINTIAQTKAVDLFNAVNPSLAIIKAGGATGSGFLCEISGKKRLVTNEHILRNGRPISAALLTGKRLKLGTAIQLGNDTDLAIIDLVDADDSQSLELSHRQPLVGERIFVFGNSDGGGVATVLEGVILGVGPDRIEIDAPFVKGNSGSPILFSDGSVVAVASYVQHSIDAKDWVKTGTRFEEVRRFGLKIENVDWVSMTPKEYFKRANMLIDLELYCSELVHFLNSNKIERYEKAKHTYMYKENFGFCELIDLFSQRMLALSLLLKQKQDLVIAWGSIKRGGRPGKTSNGILFEYGEISDQIDKEGKGYAHAAGNLLNTPATWLEHYDWGTKGFQEEGEQWLAILGVMALEYKWIKGFE